MRKKNIVVFGSSKHRAIKQFQEVMNLYKIIIDEEKLEIISDRKAIIHGNPGIEIFAKWGFDDDHGIRGHRVNYAYVDVRINKADFYDYVYNSLVFDNYGDKPMIKATLEEAKSLYEYYDIINKEVPSPWS
jgi:hypothetical protein